MAGFMRLIVAAVLLALVAKVVERFRGAKSDDQAPPEWPSWGERQAANGAGAGASETGASETGASETGSRVEPETNASESTKQWAAPIDGDCPPGFPVKVKVSSGIYHVEGMMNYVRLKADRCYSSSAAAETDGYRASKM